MDGYLLSQNYFLDRNFLLTGPRPIYINCLNAQVGHEKLED